MSAAVHGPVTIHVYDCGLLEEEKKKIEASLPERADLKLHFIALPPDGLGIKVGRSLGEGRYNEDLAFQHSGTCTCAPSPWFLVKLFSCGNT
ncbi:hypothetical protein J3R82DRAFT_3554 [Butyriboletus roseoflavus]|nr:hypothetical protein J3R82DRAFT_3554 [Butyriboletus roseoflavus]